VYVLTTERRGLLWLIGEQLKRGKGHVSDLFVTKSGIMQLAHQFKMSCC
jgi:hypothetical protein